MQDNEFDDLFRAKLDNMEAEPSAEVWTNINAELDGKKRNRSILPMLSIAASIIILIIAGILFIPKESNGPIKNQKPNNLTHTQASPSVVKPANNIPVSGQATKDEQVAAIQTPVNHMARVHHAKSIETPVIQKQQDAPAIAKVEPIKIDDQPVLAVVSQKADESKKSVVPDIETPLSVKQNNIDPTVSSLSQPVLASAQIPASTKEVKPAVRKRGIHNIGDLVNLVVAKVDKRKDKVIEFTDTDDESTITGVHIGALKIKKETAIAANAK